MGATQPSRARATSARRSARVTSVSDAPTVPHGPPPVVVAQTTQPVTPVHEPAEPARRSRAPVLAAVAAVLCLGGALAVGNPGNRPPQPPDRVAPVALISFWMLTSWMASFPSMV